MHFGITIPPFADFFDPRALAEAARDAETAGWDGFFIWDHMLFGPIPVADPWVALTAIALSTERIRIGPLVTPLPRRRPTKLGRETLSLDHLSGGRLILGVGIGNFAWEWEYLGEEPDLKTRGAMLDEGLEVLTRIWSGEPFQHHGQHYTVEGELPDGSRSAQFVPAARQSPRIPIWVAGSWPNKPPFRRAARWDGVVPMKADGSTIMPADLREIVAYIKEHRAGDDPFDVVCGGATPGDEPAKAAEIASSYAEAGLTWWLEGIDPWRYGWQWEGAWPVAQMRERIRQGPPRM